MAILGDLASPFYVAMVLVAIALILFLFEDKLETRAPGLTWLIGGERITEIRVTNAP